jgi:hypothetical protein
MIDVRNEISTILHSISDIKSISSKWGKSFEQVPSACYLITGNTVNQQTSEGESTSLVQVSVHLFAETLAQAETIAQQVDEKLSEIGWYRTLYRHEAESEYEHITLMFSSNIDVYTLEHFTE